MTWGEWEQAKAAAGRHDASMRLNSAPGGGGSWAEKYHSGVLAHSAREKKQAASYLEKHLRPDVHSAGKKADPASDDVTGSKNRTGEGEGALAGLETQEGVRFCADKWSAQLKNLLERLGKEQAALQGANAAYQQGDQSAADLFRSKLSKY
ncbi:hypothetical protein [Streptomyces sp. ODS28]|uniref:hypothetical protein n=1 Tax=Streptomyces sp. ODS28 TaxID=3136688 RepID=UPI0031F05673